MWSCIVIDWSYTSVDTMTNTVRCDVCENELFTYNMEFGKVVIKSQEVDFYWNAVKEGNDNRYMCDGCNVQFKRVELNG